TTPTPHSTLSLHDALPILAGVKELDDGARNVALESLGAGRQEERIIPPPHRKQRRLVGPEIGLESRVQRDVALVVAKQVKLQIQSEHETPELQSLTNVVCP